MMYYNRKTQELSSTPPWGAAFLLESVKRARYLDWEEVSDDYLPDRQTVYEIEEASVNKAEIQLAEALIEIYDILEGRS